MANKIKVLLTEDNISALGRGEKVTVVHNVGYGNQDIEVSKADKAEVQAPVLPVAEPIVDEKSKINK